MLEMEATGRQVSSSYGGRYIGIDRKVLVFVEVGWNWVKGHRLLV